MNNFFHSKLCRYIGLVISILIVLSCVYNYIISPEIMCLLNDCRTSTFRTMVSMFPRSVAITCMISRITVMYKNTSAMVKYKKKIKGYEVYYPITAGKEKCRRFFTIAVVFLYSVMILPTNIYRIYLIDYYYKNIWITESVLLMYIQNLSMSMTEIQFLVHCFGLYAKFRSINEDMSTMKSITISMNRYPFVLKSEEHKNITLCPSVRSIELLKMRHQFVCESVSDLNKLYCIQLGMSMSVLFIMVLFDIYEVVTTEWIITKTLFLLYGWLTQYMFRFVIFTLTSHITTKQGHRTKLLITDIHNRHLDSRTKEELRMFLNQVCNHSMEFTTFDFLTLNTHLITSAIVAGTTYIVILLQFS